MKNKVNLIENNNKSIEFEQCAKMAHTERMLGGNNQP